MKEHCPALPSSTSAVGLAGKHRAVKGHGTCAALVLRGFGSAHWVVGIHTIHRIIPALFTDVCAPEGTVRLRATFSVVRKCGLQTRVKESSPQAGFEQPEFALPRAGSALGGTGSSGSRKDPTSGDTSSSLPSCAGSNS